MKQPPDQAENGKEYIREQVAEVQLTHHFIDKYTASCVRMININWVWNKLSKNVCNIYVLPITLNK